jgi:hypothetical protein
LAANRGQIVDACSLVASDELELERVTTPSLGPPCPFLGLLDQLRVEDHVAAGVEPLFERPHQPPLRVTQIEEVARDRHVDVERCAFADTVNEVEGIASLQYELLHQDIVGEDRCDDSTPDHQAGDRFIPRRNFMKPSERLLPPQRARLRRRERLASLPARDKGTVSRSLARCDRRP